MFSEALISYFADLINKIPPPSYSRVRDIALLISLYDFKKVL